MIHQGIEGFASGQLANPQSTVELQDLGTTCFMIVYGPSSNSKVTYLYLRKLWHETKKMVISYCILPALTNYDG